MISADIVPVDSALATGIDKAIDEMVAGGASLADHEDLWPSFRELRSWYWGQVYESLAEAVQKRTALMQAFGSSEAEAQAEAERFADQHGYVRMRRSAVHTFRGPSIIDAVKTAIPIEAVARELTELRQGRNSLTGRCPFHADRSPSFVVWPARGLWRCYGACAEGGDVVKLWQRAREKGLAR